MAKPSKRPTREQRKRLNSTLADHKKEGRTLKPPFRTIENFRSVTWMKDTMPDMLWLCSIISTNGQMSGLLGCTRVLDIVDDIAGPYISHLDERDKPIFDGRLTTFERVPEPARTAILQELEAQGLHDLAVPEGFAHSIGLYPGAPGRWLIARWLERGMSINWEIAQRYLAPIFVDADHGQSQVATDAKFIVLRQYFKAGKIILPANVETGFELLPRYPDRLTEEELRKARPTIRASFLAFVGPD
ncbi:MAG: hypothetical protein QOF33_3920, partial [Thermomicrobiales bacterium]|nr:hypothetical protein [Thermomicrobiales bacterium]